MRENTDQKNSEYRHFSHSVRFRVFFPFAVMKEIGRNNFTRFFNGLLNVVLKFF